MWNFPNPQVSSQIPQTDRCSWHPVGRVSVMPAGLRLKDERRRPAVFEERCIKGCSGERALWMTRRARWHSHQTIILHQINSESPNQWRHDVSFMLLRRSSLNLTFTKTWFLPKHTVLKRAIDETKVKSAKTVLQRLSPHARNPVGQVNHQPK